MTPKWMEGLQSLCKCRHDPEKTGLNWGFFLSPNTLQDAVLRLFQGGFFLEDITGLDSAEGLVAIYHLSRYSNPERVALYVVVTREDPFIPTISAVYSGALWHEREAMDFFGIHFTGHPDPKPLLLPEDMTDHPLLKQEKRRVALRDLLNPGEIVERDFDFLFFEEPCSPADESNPNGEMLKATEG